MLSFFIIAIFTFFLIFMIFLFSFTNNINTDKANEILSGFEQITKNLKNTIIINFLSFFVIFLIFDIEGLMLYPLALKFFYLIYLKKFNYIILSLCFYFFSLWCCFFFEWKFKILNLDGILYKKLLDL